MIQSLAEIKQPYRQRNHICIKFGVIEIGVFGSYVRGEQHSDSDIDVMVTLTAPPKISLLGLVDLQYYLSDVLGLAVDVAIKKNLRKRIGKRILSEVQSI